MKNSIIPVVAIILMVSGCTPKVDIEAEKTAVRAVINDVNRAFETNDPELLAQLVSHSPDNIFFGTDMAERWVGFNSFIEAQKQFFVSLEIGSEITMHDVVFAINKSGDAAWMSYLMDWKGKSQGESFNIEGLRATVVMEKKDGKWMIVHWHGSVPVSGQMVEY